MNTFNIIAYSSFHLFPEHCVSQERPFFKIKKEISYTPLEEKIHAISKVTA